MNKKFWKDAVDRAVRTMAQTALTMITVGQMLTDVDWIGIASISITAGVASVLTSIAKPPKDGE